MKSVELISELRNVEGSIPTSLHHSLKEKVSTADTNILKMAHVEMGNPEAEDLGGMYGVISSQIADIRYQSRITTVI